MLEFSNIAKTVSAVLSLTADESAHRLVVAKDGVVIKNVTGQIATYRDYLNGVMVDVCNVGDVNISVTPETLEQIRAWRSANLTVTTRAKIERDAADAASEHEYTTHCNRIANDGLRNKED